MMHWNYRVFFDGDAYTIREVYYNEQGKIVGCTESPSEPFGESPDELAQDLTWLQEALKQPVLTAADMPNLPHNQQKTQSTTSLEEVRRQLGLEKIAVAYP